jgi:hypothetical protein
MIGSMGYQDSSSFNGRVEAAAIAVSARAGLPVNLTVSFTPGFAHVFPACVFPGHAAAGVGDALRRRAVSTAVARPGSGQY